MGEKKLGPQPEGQDTYDVLIVRQCPNDLTWEVLGGGLICHGAHSTKAEALGQVRDRLAALSAYDGSVTLLGVLRGPDREPSLPQRGMYVARL